MQADQKQLQSQTQDKEFLDWLSPSYWLVEAQLSAARKQRAAGTLQWVRNLSELRAWHCRESNIMEQTLWIRGAPGVGKSTIAAYLVDFIKCLYPDSIVTYFFCKNGQVGLMTARDILRTFAYQCMANPAVRSKLENLKESGFKLEEKLGVSFLFEKLLKEPLDAVNNDLYIILDGLDEADEKVQDEIEKRPELDILIQCLAGLPRCRFAVFSRPPSDVVRMIPVAITRSITIYDNSHDIRTYVEQVINKSDKLQRHFQKASLNPVEYFLPRAQGIFLWVDLVLQELSKANSKSVFKQYLENFSQMAGNMSQLYTSVLCRMGNEDTKWAKEIMKWLMVCKTFLNVKELQEMVERSLEDEHDDFSNFLQVQCGSFLCFVGGYDGSVYVQLIHETFRSFLVDAAQCPSNFLIDLDVSHTQVTLLCLDVLGATEENRTVVSAYAMNNWMTHLNTVTKDETQVEKLLVRVYQFLRSQDMIRYFIKIDDGIGIGFSADDHCLHFIGDWIMEIVKLTNTGRLPSSCDDGDQDPHLRQATEWSQIIQHNKYALKESVGKAAAKIWLHQTTNDFGELAAAFRLAMKHYLNRENSITCSTELTELMATEFKALAFWADDELSTPIKKQNLGVVYFSLRRWEECIECFKAAINSGYDSYQVWMYLGKAYMGKHDYNHAITAFEKAVQKFSLESIKTMLPIDPLTALYSLSNAYKTLGRTRAAIETIERVIKKAPAEPQHWDNLFRAYAECNNVDAAVKVYERAHEMNPTKLWPKYRLSEVYRLLGDFTKEARILEIVLERAFEMFPADLLPHGRFFGDVLPSRLEFRGVVETIKAPTSLWVTLACRLAYAYQSGREFKTGIKTLQRLEMRMEERLKMTNSAESQRLRESRNEMYLTTGEVFKQQGDSAAAIEAFEKVTNKESSLFWLFGLSEAFVENGDFRCVLELFERSAILVRDCDHIFIEWLQAKGRYDTIIKFTKFLMERDFNGEPCTVISFADDNRQCPYNIVKQCPYSKPQL